MARTTGLRKKGLLKGLLVMLITMLGQPALAMPTSLNTWLNNAGSGAMLVRGGAESPWAPALLLDTEVDIRVSGPVAHVTVTQQFRHQGRDFVEGQYVFPLAEQAAVHGMVLQVGERRIVGAIHEKQQAREIYAQARAQGQRAGLVEQRRPNLFVTSVANIAPGDTVSVELEYTELLVPDALTFGLRFPMTMTPRYTPRHSEHDALHDTPHGSHNTSHSTPHPTQSANGAPVEGPLVEGPIVHQSAIPETSHQARIRVYVDAGMALDTLTSPSHRIGLEYDGRGYQIILPDEQVPMDRDFVLNWRLPEGADSQAALFTEEVNGEHYGLLMLTPGLSGAAARASQQVSEQPRLPRDVILIVDTSGSMAGERMRQAKESLQYALSRLQPEDHFNVLEFNHRHRMLYRASVPASPDNLREATEWVGRLQAGGGTEMLPVLEAALTSPSTPGYLRQVIFITDGAVSNEEAVLQMIERRIHRARLFTVGIGAAPNSYLLRRAADIGRGQFTYIGGSANVSQHMSRLFEKLEQPVLTDLRIVLPDGMQAEIWPSRLPDLYAGQPLMATLKFTPDGSASSQAFPASVILQGKSPVPWEQEVVMPVAQQHAGVSTLWAREKITALSDRMVRGEPEDAVRDEIIDVALAHRLASRYTSFVAVEQRPVRGVEEPLSREAVANRNPVDHVYPQTSLGLARLWWLALACWLLVAVLLVVRKKEQRCVGVAA
ncbi:MAG: marine proteobacterial sortase target protein [Alcanivorax sp.]|nr:marine proteobacterial sortase target protein [Alcanivorax sp.]